ncbi:hypothetical protein C8F04DRAFT_223802 [Mycena alexandri]|uniref:BTB domain-containing protein n=1 Tax=Mycena alexandri TaxID=1745969 RepID=A0AAD6XAA1_9AGAR|nr:hypothetical protein C8F04DRAFT_1263214 [Mycena alexandri]KAJ7040641.1 hypothetical protein C8F04DRAFT_223802 [Mycena alexandri]
MSDSTPSENTGTTVHNAPVENVGQWTKNLTYWHADGSIVMRVEGTLYKIHVSTLGKLSPDMSGILAIPSGKPEGDPTQEGTERFPLHLTGLSVQQFEDFLCWLYRVEWTPMTDRAEKERILTNLLKVTDLWNIEVGKQYAITHLQAMSLPASRRLELARKYSIHDWVEGAVTDIFQHKLSVLSDVDLASLDLKVYSILVRGMERMEVEIRRTANVAPKMPDASQADWRCSKHQVCIATWKRLWWDRIGRKLLHPDAPIRTGDIVKEVKQLSHKDLNEMCRLDMVKEIENNLEFVDKRIISAVVTAIVAYHSAIEM